MSYWTPARVFDPGGSITVAPGAGGRLESSDSTIGEQNALLVPEGGYQWPPAWTQQPVSSE